MMTLYAASQVAIPILGTTAILLMACKNRWGVICGLASQPFWFYAAYTGRQWGIFAASFAYTASWAVGFYNWFLRQTAGEEEK